MNGLMLPAHPMFIEACAMYAISIGALICLNLYRLFVDGSYPKGFGWLIGQAIKLTDEPVPGCRGLPVILAAFVAYRCVIFGPPSFVIAQRWTGLPFSRFLPPQRVLAIELLSNAAILELTRQLLETLQWVEAAISAAMRENPTDLILALLGSAAGLSVTILQASAYIVYVAAAFELFKALDRVLPDVARHAAFVGFFCGWLYCHLYC
ncbi:hypothetical protein M434DRAFT_16181 [Hypoxylon sp. CO27-5]|nr:hypothetical protein M434DRAFT_16181 [Hypoxylon sp. CO27-5]